MNKKHLFYILSTIIALSTIFLLTNYTINSNKKKVMYNIVNEFLTLFKEKRIDDALNMLYFKEENKIRYYDITKEGFEDDTLIDYKINKLERLNDKIYRFHISLNNKYKSEFKPFVVNINGEWRLILHQRDISDELKKNVNIPRNPNEIDAEELIQ